jgi:hypothetical protein
MTDGSTARLDYALISQELFRNSDSQIFMNIGSNLDKRSDHQPLFVELTVKMTRTTDSIKPWSVRRPKVPGNPEQKLALRNELNRRWISSNHAEARVDDSERLASFLVDDTSSIVGHIGGTTNIRTNRHSQRVLAQLNALKAVTSLCREYNEQGPSRRLEELIIHHAQYLIRKGLREINLPLDLRKIMDWINRDAQSYFQLLRRHLALITDNLKNCHKTREHKLFTDPTKRGEWLRLVGLGKHRTSTPRTITSSDKKETYTQAEDIKETYLREGSATLTNEKYLNEDSAAVPMTTECPDIRNPRPFVEEKIQCPPINPHGGIRCTVDTPKRFPQMYGRAS